MLALVGMQQFLTILAFYKRYVVWSFLATVLIVVLFPFIVPAVITKISLLCILWYFLNETNAKRSLKIINKIGVSTAQLLSVILAIDLVFTLGFLVVIKEFI